MGFQLPTSTGTGFQPSTIFLFREFESPKTFTRFLGQLLNGAKGSFAGFIALGTDNQERAHDTHRAGLTENESNVEYRKLKSRFSAKPFTRIMFHIHEPDKNDYRILILYLPNHPAIPCCLYILFLGDFLRVSPLAIPSHLPPASPGIFAFKSLGFSGMAPVNLALGPMN